MSDLPVSRTIALAERMQAIEPFRVMALLARAKQLQAEGRDIIHMEIGEPDFTTAEPIIAAAQEALAQGKTTYTQALGIPELRTAISAWYQKQYGIDVPASRIVVTPGGSGALLLLSALLMNPNDELLMSDPSYPCNRHFLRLVEGKARLIETTATSRYQLTPAMVREHWNEHTKGVLVASPSNPTGELLSREQLQALAQVCRELGGVLLVDEIYHGMVYGEDAVSVLEVADDVLVLNSFSKYFGMTGWRIGWLVAPEALIPEIEKLAQNLYISVQTISQYAALAAFSPEAVAIHEARRAEFAQRRDYLVQALRDLGLIIPNVPAGAFYVYADVSAFTQDSRNWCLQLLEQEGVAVTPGEDFGTFRCDEHVRFAYTDSLPRLQEAVARIQRFIQTQSV
ncbi:pyridoxal phosphate-dependent aminotransferase [Vitreoscilla stercoraria]|uniref:Aminotransferase n=1 Tax=Vitreoscilla stercoraria TaxID=61 RepID=A0ABY4ECM5_VITST|nr:pyridoxal phosphate-dependent aminotransferase [Vitreoscilla stercoraria]UOO92373.1 pyridoxal phosphate-dependent aminotransferase [Vitreoscilla stercoraria]